MEILKECLVVLRYIGFWGIWVGRFLLYEGIEKGWGEKHHKIWIFLITATSFFWSLFKEYLDWRPPTPCLIGVFVLGFLIGRYVLLKK